MPTKPLATNFPVLKSGGTVVIPATMRRLLELEVEKTYNRPDMLLMRFDLDARTDLPPVLELGKELELSFKEDSTTTRVFKGEVTALEVDASGGRTVFIVQAEDKLHRFFRVDKSRTFLKKSLSDIAKTMAGEHNVGTGGVAATSTTYEFLMQQNVSNGAFLQLHAAQHNLHFGIDDNGNLLLDEVGKGGDSGVEVKNGAELLSFNLRVTGNAFLKEAEVRSWDWKQKKEIVSKASSAAAPKDPKVAAASYNSGAGTATLVRTGAPAAADASSIAKAAMERSNEHNRQVEGTCYGKAKLAIDKLIGIKGVNTRFDGKYRVSHIRHRFSESSGFLTDFACRGASDQSIVALVEETAGSVNRASDRDIFDGVAVGIVTDNTDPEELGRVKVKFPTLAADLGSDWMRIAFPGGGGPDHHGLYLLPEVDDEVLVAFEQGDARRGYVLGGLLNGKDKPFYKNDKVLSNGKVNQHALRLKSGAHLLLDETSGAEVVEIKNKDGGFTFKFEEKNGVTVKNETSGDKMVIDNKGNITVTSQSGDITIEAKAGGINLTAVKDITLDAKGKVAIKATQDATIDGLNVKVNAQAQAEVKGNATATLQSSGQTVVKGTMVMIN